MKTLPLIYLILILFTFSNCSRNQHSDTPEYLLRYDKPAEKWIDALPVGNGRLGAMVFGNPNVERIQFNEESLWAGSVIDNNNPKSLESLEKIQQLIFNGEYQKADQLAQESLLGTPRNVRSYQTFGDLILNYHWDGEISNYKRSLDLHTGVSTTTFEIGDNQVTQEVFASAPHDIIVVRISASEPFNVDVTLKREKDAVITAEPEGVIKMLGQIIDDENPREGPAGAHMKFGALAKVNSKKGQIGNTEDGVTCGAARAVTIYLSAATNYKLAELNFTDEIDPLEECEKTLKVLMDESYAEIKRKHVADHSAMFGRVSLKLGSDTLKYLPTDERLNRFKEGEIDNALVATYFQYGRYLLMGSSRHPGRLPANLQGVWNELYQAPWDADFHTNINLQMNYWPAEVCNLSETSVILANFMKQITVPGAVTAKKMYGTGGWTMHHLTDPFGRTGVADGIQGVTPLDGPWMTFPLYRHFEFTQDTAYLMQLYPVLKGAAEFVMDYLIESPEGYLVTNPSFSPENGFFVPGTGKNEISDLTYAATIDIQIINRLFDILTETIGILDIEDPGYLKRITSIRELLPPVQIGENGTIQEWIQDFDEVHIGHRHMSHLLGLYPLAQITPETPRYFEAAKKTIQRRLENGGGHTGWSRAWIICFYARLQDGDAAWDHVQQLLAKTTLNNLFNTHPPFQIDGNFGATAGIAEMLLQSHNGTIRLLPALPGAWPEGYVKGLKARGGFECDIFWSEGKLTEAIFYAAKGGHANIEYGSLTSKIDLEPGGKFVFRNK